ncbi:hypothetical protein Unana1_08339 [Umbelopsis nana]
MSDDSLSDDTVAVEKLPEQNPISPPPDGGREAWGVVIGGFLVFFVMFGLSTAFGTFQAYYATNQLSDWTESDISWIGSIQVFLIYACGIFAGRIFDAYGSRWLLIVGSLLFLIGVFMLSLCTQYYQIMLAQGVLLGIASALLFHPSLAVIPQWFSTKRALAIGIAVAGSALGGAIFPIILSNLFNVIGFGWTIRVVGFISLAVLAIANVLVKARLPPRGASSLDGLFEAFKNKTYALLVAGCFVLYLSTYAEAAGLDVSLAFYCLTFTNAAGVVGRTAINHAADILGRFNVLLISTSLTATFTLALWLTCSNTAAVIAYSILFGLWGGNVLPPEFYISIILIY